MTNDDNQKRVSRRRFLESLGIAGVVGASGSLLAACGGGSGDGSGGTQQSGSQGGGQGQTSGATTSADCGDLSQLSDAQKQQREQMVKSLQYVEETPNPEKNCANCQLYEQPGQEETTGSECGGCQLFPGPVTANGYCNSWVQAS
jgi:hypothetical protein